MSFTILVAVILAWNLSSKDLRIFLTILGFAIDSPRLICEPHRWIPKELETKHFASTYGLSLDHAHATHHAYIGWGATSKSCMGFICPKSHLCCLRNEQ